ncbi:unnamed protein product [Didymodactylos carnosus]|uniref:Endonuclease/exonuclease/phosphatase domain-containing protein n=1 Tax=Didymodactylos carnosus TaxID=1234261 RepID=A0A8S2QPJ3_9BILA|nr:unnamed protein product [Didymodactylos carnosus]CAF4114975.1 unnamed protein product [Didymodactylos carnosus]
MQSSIQNIIFLHTLCFHIRGLGLRWGEVLLLTLNGKFDVITLLETGKFCKSTITNAFSDYNMFYQKGENPHGGVLILIKQYIRVSRIQSDVPNICVVDLHMDESIRLIGMYAPESKNWTWNDLFNVITNKCILIGDFNVDLEEDIDNGKNLLGWADKHSLAAYTLDCPTSLRSNREIDYALVPGVQVTIRAYEGETTSDHKPIFCVIT